jgi:hypothetical protein
MPGAKQKEESKCQAKAMKTLVEVAHVFQPPARVYAHSAVTPLRPRVKKIGHGIKNDTNKIQTLIVDSAGPADGINIEANPNAKAFSALRGGLAR